MLIGRVAGKVTTRECHFSVTGETSTFEYVQLHHPRYDWVLGQVTEIEATPEGKVATCALIGYLAGGKVCQVRDPVEPGTEVFRADDDFIRKVIALPATATGAYIGKLDGRDIAVMLDLNRLLTKHVSVLAKSGAGKSYAVAVLIEEILERNVPVVIIDPHGEYRTLRTPARSKKERKEGSESTENAEESADRPARFGVQPKAYSATIYGNPSVSDANPLALSNRVTKHELVHMLPKLNMTQLGILYAAIRNAEHTDFDQLLVALEAEESMAKWSLINLVESIKNHRIFSSTPTPPNRLVQPGHATIIDLKGYPPDIQELIVYKIAKDLFELRKTGKVPPFFLVVEEAHNFCPERSFGEAGSSKILRTIASEGRKFGLGLCVISQRPARVDKSVLSQCTTQIVLKITNPHDLKAIGTSVEGLTAETERGIRNLPIGTALVTGVVDLPLVVDVRPRRTAHGGEATDILAEADGTRRVAAGEVLPLLLPNVTRTDIERMQPQGTRVTTVLLPCLRVNCVDKGTPGDPYTVLLDLTNGEIILDIDELRSRKLPALESLSAAARDALRFLLKHKRLNPHELGIPPQVVDELRSGGYLVTVRAAKDTKEAKEEKESSSTISYKLSDAYLYTKLRTAATMAALQYATIDEDARLEPRHSPEQALALLSRFARVREYTECWLVRYVARSVAPAAALGEVR